MKKIRRKNSRRLLVFTLITATLLLTAILGIIFYIYQDANAECFDRLQSRTQALEDSISLQLLSDRENLITMAGLGARLYANNEPLALLVDSFEPIGLFRDVEILLSDNTVLTNAGTISQTQLSFAAEKQKGDYFTGRVEDFINPGKEVIRSAVPIISGGDVVAILYGVMDLDAFNEHYRPWVEEQDSYFYIINSANGNFLIDTFHDHLSSLDHFEARVHKDGATYDEMCEDIATGKPGYSVVYAEQAEDYMHMYYLPMEVKGWHIMLSQTESVAFAPAYATANAIATTFILVVSIISLYVAYVVLSTHSRLRLQQYTSIIQKQLLDTISPEDNAQTALKTILDFCGSDIAFFVNTDGLDFTQLSASRQQEILLPEERMLFVSRLLQYAEKHPLKGSIQTFAITRRANAAMRKSEPEMYAFFKEHRINLLQVMVSEDTRHTDMLGVINSKRNKALMLLDSVILSFTMAVYNKIYLDKTKAIAVTDTLTGLRNRACYIYDLTEFGDNVALMGCVFIDANELHYINNAFGHSTGDDMIVSIANALRELFADSRIYRIGGDEFLVFTFGLTDLLLQERVNAFHQMLAPNNYYVSAGIALGSEFEGEGADADSVVKLAEKRMYANKAMYYQKKGSAKAIKNTDYQVHSITTGSKIVDDCLLLMSIRYAGVYRVSLESDRSTQILLASNATVTLDSEKGFVTELREYVREYVKPEYHRILFSLLNYDTLRLQLQSGTYPSIVYEKLDGEQMTLEVFPVPDQTDSVKDTIWIFEKSI